MREFSVKKNFTHEKLDRQSSWVLPAISFRHSASFIRILLHFHFLMNSTEKFPLICKYVKFFYVIIWFGFVCGKVFSITLSSDLLTFIAPISSPWYLSLKNSLSLAADTLKFFCTHIKKTTTTKRFLEKLGLAPLITSSKISQCLKLISSTR